MKEEVKTLKEEIERIEREKKDEVKKLTESIKRLKEKKEMEMRKDRNGEHEHKIK